MLGTGLKEIGLRRNFCASSVGHIRAAKTPLEKSPRRPWPRKTGAIVIRGWLD